MWRRISLRPLWRHVRRGLLLYGATVGGSMHCYQECLREEAEAEEVRWDWTVPYRWYDAAHRD
ncbi:hypothetical protein ACWEKT_06860 [Nocardia takedensis]|uniref:hypothetical protein n=1 Tax=Nocardia takedensis TaxID=259390 RepID=UPI0012F6C2F5|nr:hypothetical protein [Nocardia takedensis]